MVILTLAVIPLRLIIAFLMQDQSLFTNIANYGMLLALLLYAGSSIIALVLYPLGILIYHIVFYLFGAKEGYTRTLQAFTYGSTLGILLSWAPYYINVIAGIYTIYPTIVGLIKLQKMETWKAIVAYLIPIIAILLIALVFFLITFNTVMNTTYPTS